MVRDYRPEDGKWEIIHGLDDIEKLKETLGFV